MEIRTLQAGIFSALLIVAASGCATLQPTYVDTCESVADKMTIPDKYRNAGLFRRGVPVDIVDDAVNAHVTCGMAMRNEIETLTENQCGFMCRAYHVLSGAGVGAISVLAAVAL